MSDGATAIAIERIKQVLKGYDADHDSQHGAAELIEAARAYIVYAEGPEVQRVTGLGPDFHWPWDISSFDFDSTRLESLAKAGALLAAAYDVAAQEKS